MRLHRFYVQQPLGEEVVIDNVSLIRQWSKVFRYKEADSVILFNGDGKDYTYSIAEINQKQSTLTHVSRAVSFLPSRKVSLYVSIIKKDNFELVVQKATELGISKIIPILSARSEKKNLNMDRLQTIAVESAEQSFRGNVPEISEITTLHEAIKSVEGEPVYILSMTGKRFEKNLEIANRGANLFIGPEGGWTMEELGLFATNGALEVSITSTVLRAETAAIAAATLFLY